MVTGQKGICAGSVYSCSTQLLCKQTIFSKTEICNGKDDDCNGDADDGLSKQISCGKGYCKNTVNTCRNGIVRTCTPKAPGIEVCFNGKDEDCNGTPDDGCIACIPSKEVYSHENPHKNRTSLKVNISVFQPGTDVFLTGAEGYSDFKVWKMVNGKAIFQKAISGLVSTRTRDLSFAGDGRYFAHATSKPGLFYIKDVAGKIIHTVTDSTNRSSYRQIALNSNGTLVATASYSGGIIKIWSLPDKKLIVTLPKQSYVITEMQFSPDNKQLAISKDDRKIHIWDTSNWQKAPKVLSGHALYIGTFRFNPKNSNMLCSITRTYAKQPTEILLWDIAKGTKIKLTLPQGSATPQLSFSPDGKRIAVGNQSIEVIDVNTKKVIKSFSGYNEAIKSLSFHKNNKTLAFAFTFGFGLWDYSSNERAQALAGPLSNPGRLIVDPYGRYIGIAGTGRKLFLWDYRTRNLHTITPIYNSSYPNISFHVDGKSFFVDRKKDEIHQIDLKTLQVLRILKVPTNRQNFTLSHDGTRFAFYYVKTGNKRVIEVRDLLNNTVIQTIPTSAVKFLFSPDDKSIAVIYTGVVQAWEIASL